MPTQDQIDRAAARLDARRATRAANALRLLADALAERLDRYVEAVKG